MRFWFDTEFYENGRTIELISIGVVAEDGREYYAETEVAGLLAKQTDWLRKNVLPSLTGQEKSRFKIPLDLIEFMGSKPEIWAYYAAYDWVVLCQLFGTMMDLPKGRYLSGLGGWPMYCRDVKQLCDSKGNPKLPEQSGIAHNALSDARWTKQAWEFLTNG